MAPVEVTAIFSPKPEKMERCLEILHELCTAVERDQKTTSKFFLTQCFTPPNYPQDPHAPVPSGIELMMVETFEDQAAHEAHEAGPRFKKMIKTMADEEIFAKPTVVKFGVPIPGFGFRSRQ